MIELGAIIIPLIQIFLNNYINKFDNPHYFALMSDPAENTIK